MSFRAHQIFVTHYTYEHINRHYFKSAEIVFRKSVGTCFIYLLFPFPVMIILLCFLVTPLFLLNICFCSLSRKSDQIYMLMLFFKYKRCEFILVNYVGKKRFRMGFLLVFKGSITSSIKVNIFEFTNEFRAIFFFLKRNSCLQ